jgi:hypothetical protein
MQKQRSDEDLGGVTLRQLLALQATAGPDQPIWLPDGSGLVIKSAIAGKPALRVVDAANGTQARPRDRNGQPAFPQLAACHRFA